MSDERLRELERRWKETGSVEDEAAFLLERVRAGELTQERLELAAYCGQPAAELATHRSKGKDLSFRLFVTGLGSHGRLGAQTALAMSLGALVSVWPEERSRPAYLTLEAWLDCPCRQHADRVTDSVAALEADATQPSRSAPCLYIAALANRRQWRKCAEQAWLVMQLLYTDTQQEGGWEALRMPAQRTAAEWLLRRFRPTAPPSTSTKS